MSELICTSLPVVKTVVRSADTGCAVYLDASASPSGIRHGGPRCRCLPIHGPDEMASVVRSIRTLLASEGPGPGLFFKKPSYEISLVLLGVVAPSSPPHGGRAREGKTKQGFFSRYSEGETDDATSPGTYKPGLGNDRLVQQIST